MNLRAVVLVGHGGVPKNFPADSVMRLKRLESQRRASGAPPSDEESELNAKIRTWPRTPENDPYQAGLERLASRLRQRFNGALFAVAYNEFCAPTLEEAVQTLVSEGATDVTVVSSMFTPGGSHAEVEIPETIQYLRSKHPAITFRYAWPFDLDMIAEMMTAHVARFTP